MSPADIETLFATLAAADPDPRTELASENVYQLLVAVVLSAQSTDVGVNRATAPLFASVHTPADMLALGEDKLRGAIRTLGLFNNKAANVIALSRMLVDEHGGQVPRDREALTRLPGVGRKTANVVLNVHWGDEAFAVDTHIFRVCNRTGLAPGKTPEQVEAGLERDVPGPYRVHAHHWLILHGRYVCKARTPECWRCPIADVCAWPDKTLAPRNKRGSERVQRSSSSNVG